MSVKTDWSYSKGRASSARNKFCQFLELTVPFRDWKVRPASSEKWKAALDTEKLIDS